MERHGRRSKTGIAWTALLAGACCAAGCGGSQSGEPASPAESSLSVESAIGSFSDAIQFEPLHAEPFYSQAVAHQAKGELNEAFAAFSE
ncbi:MAG: hypothetical protein JJ992_13565, partial [Planctomycetes bacterium]|nr:hypothetical protein [Planctomycetota bacterium]